MFLALLGHAIILQFARKIYGGLHNEGKAQVDTSVFKLLCPSPNNAQALGCPTLEAVFSGMATWTRWSTMKHLW